MARAFQQHADIGNICCRVQNVPNPGTHCMHDQFRVTFCDENQADFRVLDVEYGGQSERIIEGQIWAKNEYFGSFRRQLCEDFLRLPVEGISGQGLDVPRQ
ncbi:hypothetical protein GCM10027402_02610 [Arthrobacter monumenti]